MNDGVVVVKPGVLVADDDGTPSTCNNKHDDDDDDCKTNNELDNLLSTILNVISIDLPLFSSMIERTERKKDDVICKAVDELLSKINSCLFRVDTFRGSMISDDDEEDFLTKVDTLLTNCQTGYSTVLSSLLEHPHCLQHFTVQTVILDCLVEQAFISLTWKKTRQVILDCIPYIYSCCCCSHHNKYNNNHNNNTSILLEAFKEVLNRNYSDALVPILSCLFSNDLFLEEAMSIALHAFSSLLEDDQNLDPNDFSFLIKTLLIHSQAEQEVTDIALQIHNKCTTMASSSEIDIVIGLLVSDLIMQPYPNKDCYSSQSKLIIRQGFTGHITNLLQQTMAVHLTIPDFYAILSLYYISNTTADTSWNHNNNNIQNLLRQCWVMEMNYCSNHDNISNSSIVFVLGKVIQRMINYVEIDNKNDMVQLLLQTCAELVVWMLIMTTSTTKTERQRKIIQDHFFKILHQLMSDNLQSWILETFLSLSSPMIQMELNACCTKKQNQLEQQPQQICVLSFDFFIFLIQQQQLQEQQHPKNRFLQYFTSIHPNIATTFMVRFVDMADRSNNNNLTITALHKLSFILSYFIINIDNNTTSNFLLFLQKLFFNHNFTNANNKICKQCIGILLSTHLIHRILTTTNKAYYDDVSSIFDWTCQVLHSSTAVIDENSNMIGAYGCYFLSVCGVQVNDIDQSEQQSKGLPTTVDCNNHCKELLAATGLIQSEQSLTRHNNYVLGFGDAQLPETASVRRPLVLCATDLFFSRGGCSFSSPNTTNKGNASLVTFVFRLIHTYLTLGRKCSTSWAPLSWLTMKLQLPAWPLVVEINGGMEPFWQVWCLRLDENDNESRYDNLDDDIVQPLLQVAWIGCIAISAILAILHHAHDSPNNNRTMLTHLIRFQLARIYSLEIVVEKCCRLLISNRTGKGGKKCLVATQANEIQKCLGTQKLSYLDISLLCTALCYSSNTEDVLNKLMTSDVQPGTKKMSEPSLLHEVYLRICLLESFAKALRQRELDLSLDTTDYYGDDPATFLPFRFACLHNDTPDVLLQIKENMTCIVKIVEATQFLIPWLCRLRRLQLTAYGTERTLKEKVDYISLELATRLASAHYEVIRAVLLRGRTGNQSDDQPTFTFAPLFVNFVRSSVVQLQSDLSSTDSLAPCLEHMFHFFSRQLKQCEDGSIATQLIDILSLLTYGVNKAHVTKDLIWKAIHTIYPTNLDVLSLTDSRRLLMERRVLSSPFDVFQQKISQFLSMTLKQISNNSAVGPTFSMLEKVFTCTNKKSFRHCYVLRHMLISLWVLSPAEETYSYLRKLFLALKSFVEKTISEELRHFTTTSKKRRPKVSSRASDDEMVPGLTRNSISPFFDILITTVAASLVMCLPNAEKAIATSSSTARTPYRGIQNQVLLLIDMIDFFQQSFKVFSKDSVALLLRICIILIKSMEWQLSACIAWRNSRPLLTEDEEEAGYVDLASVSLLQPLIDSYASFAGAIAAFCDKIRSQATNKGRMKNLETTLDADIEGESWIYASFQNSVATLLLRCEKFVVALRETSSAHNLRPPRFKEGVTYREHEHITEKNVSSMTASEQNWSDIDGLGVEEFFVEDSMDDEDMSSVDFSNDSESFTAVGWGGDVDDDSV